MAKCYEILETLNCKTKKQNTNQICEGKKKNMLMIIIITIFKKLWNADNALKV